MAHSVGPLADKKSMKFGLIFFSSSETAAEQENRYRLVIESAKFIDQHGFSSLWIPERHFTKDGWLYPNPVVLQAALALQTKHIQLRAGSVVMPLHNPVRVAEEWAMVDNLSNGRVGLSFASGWHANDFVFFPEKYAERHEEMYRGVEIVRKLWRGETVKLPGGDGREVEVRTYPPPVQPELPIWITAAGNPQTFARAGEIGANLLTHMFNQGLEELAHKIKLYRQSLASHGYDARAGQVTVMLHTFVGDGRESLHRQAREAFCDYLKSASYLLNAIAQSRGQQVDFNSLSKADLDDYVEFIFERFVSSRRVLFGTPEECLDFMGQLAAIGVDEVACQVDWGLDVEVTLDSLRHLHRLQELCRSENIAQHYQAYALANATAETFTAAQPESTSTAQSDSARAAEHLQDIRARCTEEIDVGQFYSHLANYSDYLDSSFRGIEVLKRCAGEAFAQVRLLDVLEHETDSVDLHSVFLDASVQVLLASLPPETALAGEGTCYLPRSLHRLQIYSGHGLWIHARLRSGENANSDYFEGDVHLFDEQGKIVAQAAGLRLQRAEQQFFDQSLPAPDQLRPAADSLPGGTTQTREAILAAQPAEREQLLQSYLRGQVAVVLKLPVSKVDLEEPVNQLGIDSLMAVDLKKRVETDLRVVVRIASFLQGYSTGEIAGLLLDQITDGAETPAAVAPSPASAGDVEQLLERIDELSEQEINALLSGMMAEEEVNN
jgi:phthiocerol/phenolphthiocerol synthesis type-I polyketide synthase D